MVVMSSGHRRNITRRRDIEPLASATFRTTDSGLPPDAFGRFRRRQSDHNRREYVRRKGDRALMTELTIRPHEIREALERFAAREARLHEVSTLPAFGFGDSGTDGRQAP